MFNLVRSLSKTIDAEVQGEMATLKETVNSMVSRLRVFSSEVTRVAREVGTDGQLGGQAVVHGVEGTWKELVSAFLSPRDGLCGPSADGFGCTRLDRVGEPHGSELDAASARDRLGYQGGRARRFEQDGRYRRFGRDPGAQDDGQLDGQSWV